MKEQHGPIKEQHGPVLDGQEKRPFGNYDLVRRIDVGGMGEVYLARQRTAFGREVAIKIIRSDLANDVTARKRFLREAEVSAHLKHEHILPLVEFGEEQGRLFLVTPYIPGGTLARRLHTGPLSLIEVYQLFTPLVQAVAYIHKRGVIHRDLKPSNVLLDREEGSGQIYVRLIDFGISSLPGMNMSPSLTASGKEVGTAAYMAPERLKGIAAPSNDIYSLGVILYQMLSGHLPATGQEKGALPAELEAIVYRCTAAEPGERYASADELLKAFEQAYRTLSTTPRPQPSNVVEKISAIQETPMPELDDPGNTPAPRPRRQNPTAPQPAVKPLSTNSKSMRAIRRSDSAGLAPLPRPGKPLASNFNEADYDAPTSYLDPANVQKVQGTQGRQLRLTGVADSNENTNTLGGSGVSRPGIPPKRRRPALAIIPISIVLVLLLIIAMTYFALQTVTTAKITLIPQVHSVSKVFTITARPSLQRLDPGTSSMPVNTLTVRKTASKTGPTSGRPFLCLLDCPKVVSTDDVNSLGLQLKQSLIAQITKDLNTQLQSKKGSQVGKPVFTDVNGSFNPQVGARSDTVTVTLTEQGVLRYYTNADAQTLTRQLLQQEVEKQFGKGFSLISQLTQISQPAVQGTDAAGNVTLAVAAGGVAQFQITDTQISDIQNHIKGMTLKDARAFLEKQQGIDARSISLQVNYGEKIPTDTGQIKISRVDPTDLPSVQLPKVQGTPVTTP